MASRMSRIAKPMPVSSKMYRHFAVLTVVITAGLAFFASGEQSNSMAAELAAKQAKRDAQHEQDKVRLAEVQRSNLRDARGGGGGGGGFTVGEGSIDPDSEFATSAEVVGSTSRFGPPADILVRKSAAMKLTPAEYENFRLNATKPGSKRPRGKPTAEQEKQLSSYWDQRSGFEPQVDN